jgi:hypothetical protein
MRDPCIKWLHGLVVSSFLLDAMIRAAPKAEKNSRCHGKNLTVWHAGSTWATNLALQMRGSRSYVATSYIFIFIFLFEWSGELVLLHS